MKQLHDSPITLIDEIEHFFIQYNQQADKVFTPLARRGAKHATALVTEASTSKEKDQGRKTR